MNEFEAYYNDTNFIDFLGKRFAYKQIYLEEGAIISKIRIKTYGGFDDDFWMPNFKLSLISQNKKSGLKKMLGYVTSFKRDKIIFRKKIIILNEENLYFLKFVFYSNKILTEEHLSGLEIWVSRYIN